MTTDNFPPKILGLDHATSSMFFAHNSARKNLPLTPTRVSEREIFGVIKLVGAAMPSSQIAEGAKATLGEVCWV